MDINILYEDEEVIVCEKPAGVISMSIFEYDKEEEEKKLRKAEYEAGEKSGIQKGVLNTARHLLELNLLSLENISRATGLSIDELKKLQQ